MTIEQSCNQLWDAVVEAYDRKDIQAIDCINQEVDRINNLIEARLRILLLGSPGPEIGQVELPSWATEFFSKETCPIVEDAKKLLLALATRVELPEAEIDPDFYLSFQKDAIEISWGGHIVWLIKKSKFRWPGINVRLFCHNDLESPKFVANTFFVANHLIDETVKGLIKLKEYK